MRLKTRLRLFWFRLWIRRDEFDCFLSMDPLALMGMNDKEQEKYIHDLIRRRRIAHERDLERLDHSKRPMGVIKP